jgi:hypothetical protein
VLQHCQQNCVRLTEGYLRLPSFTPSSHHPTLLKRTAWFHQFSLAWLHQFSQRIRCPESIRKLVFVMQPRCPAFTSSLARAKAMQQCPLVLGFPLMATLQIENCSYLVVKRCLLEYSVLIFSLTELRFFTRIRDICFCKPRMGVFQWLP